MQALHDRIGVGYDATRKADPWIARRLADYLRIRDGERYIDVGCGTGNYTIALASLGARITGIDASREMLDTARAKAPDNAALGWRLARAESLPCATGSLAGAVSTLAIHHFSDLPGAFREVSRVLDPVTGRYVIFTSTPEQTSRYWLRRYFPAMIARSMRRLPSLGRLREALAAAGLPEITTEPYTIQPDVEDGFLYSGKLCPQLYLDPRVRAGMSSFASFPDAAEIERGVSRLADDIASGRIAEVIDEARSMTGAIISSSVRNGARDR